MVEITVVPPSAFQLRLAGDFAIPKHYEQASILRSQRIPDRNFDFIKSHIRSTSRRRIRSLDSLRLDALSPLDEYNREPSISPTANSEVIREMAIRNPPNDISLSE